MKLKLTLRAQSSNANLSDLTASSSADGNTFSPLSLNETFDKATTTYTASVPNSTTHVKLTPTVEDSNASVKVGKSGNLSPVTSGTASDAISLSVGANAIEVEVTAEDGTTKTYTVTVTRAGLIAVSVAFGSATYGVDETDDTTTTMDKENEATVTVTLSADPERTVTIPLNKTNQGGATSADYSGVPASVTFNSGNTEQSFTFSATADTIDDDGESVKLTFGTLPTGVTEGTTKEATVSITDDDVPAVSVSFEQSSYTVAEGSTVSVKVKLSAAPERSVEIPVTKSNQGGASASDYSGVPTSLTFATTDTEKTFTFSATQDNVDDDGESVDLGFGTLPTRVSAGSTSTASVSITDDDATVLTITPNQTTRVYGATEDLGFSVGGLADGDTKVQVVSGTALSRTTGNDVGSYTLSLTGLSIKSGFTDKYALPTAPASTTYTITKREITAISGVTVNSRDWDGGVTATFDTSGATGTGVLTGEVSDFQDGGLVVTGSFPAAARTSAGTHSLSVTYSLQTNSSFKSGNYTITTSAQSGSLSGTLNAVVPGPPRSVAAAAGPQKLTVTWTAPSSNGGSAITGYRVRWRTAQVGQMGDQDYAAAGNWQDADGDDNTGQGVGNFLTYSITSLTNGKTYDVQAAAVNTAGTGPFAPATPAQGTPNVPAVTVAFEQSSYTVAEGSSVTVKVKLSVAPERSVSIPITKSNQGGASTGDYSGVPASLSFRATDTEKSITFSATADDVDDDGESVNLGFGTLPTGVSSGSTSTASVSITDDDVPSVSVSFEQSSYTVAESDNPSTTEVSEHQVVVKVKLSADPERTVTVPITKANQGGATSADYSGVPASVTFNSGDTEKTFTFSATSDTVDDDGESVKLTFGTLPTGVTEGTTKEATVSITDDDVPSVTVSFEQSSYTVAEGSSVTVKVKLSSAPERSVEIPITKSNQGGASTGDYSGVPASLSFGATDTEKSITFSATQDNVDDDSESVNLGFGTLPTRVSAGTNSTAAVSITDDDVPSVTVSFEQSSYTVAEGSSATVKVKLSSAPERSVEIPITKSNQGGASSGDYSGVPASLSFGATDTEKSITFSATQDNVDDDSESVNLGFGTLPTRVSAGTNSTAAVSITDDDVPSVTVSFEQSSYTVSEGSSVTVKVKLSAAPERSVEIPITKSNQGGASTGDYSGVPASLSFGATDTEKSIVFSATQDNVDDDGESVNLGFGTLPTRVSAGTNSTAAVSITDDDVPSVTVSFEQSSYTVSEGSSVTVKVKLSAVPERSVEVPITKSNQGGASTGDYSGVPASLSFGATDTEKSITFSATQDNVDDDGESVNLGFGTLPTRVSAETNNTASVTITDDDVPSVTVAFEQSSYTVAESDNPSTTEVSEHQAVVKVKLSADPERTVTIPLNKSNQGGATSADYSGVPASVTFNSGDTEQSFTFSATADTIDDDGESVKLTFGTLPTGVTEGTTKETTVSITDDDVPSVTVAFEQSTYTVAEGSSVSVKVKLSAAPERSVEIPVTKSNQGGAASGDYSGVPTSLTFGATDTEKTITFAAAQDNVDDDGESVNLGFGTLPARVRAGSTSTASVTITDDDVPSVTVAFEQSSYTVAESDNPSTTEVSEHQAVVKVKLSADPERTVTIPLNKANQGGATSADYSGVPASVTFNSGDTEKTFTFSATADTIDDDGESVKLTFGTLPTGVSAGSTDETTVSITDDHVPQAKTFSLSPTASVTEGHSATLTITLSEDAPADGVRFTVTAAYSTTGTGNADSSDVGTITSPVTVVNGNSTLDITIPISQSTRKAPILVGCGP